MGEALRQMADVKYSLDDNIKQNFLEPLHHLQTKDLKEVMVSVALFDFHSISPEIRCTQNHKIFQSNCVSFCICDIHCSIIAKNYKVDVWTTIASDVDKQKVFLFSSIVHISFSDVRRATLLIECRAQYTHPPTYIVYRHKIIIIIENQNNYSNINSNVCPLPISVFAIYVCSVLCTRT